MSKLKYIPALKYQWLTVLYDNVLKYTMPENAFKSELINRANIQPKDNILDFGCGTATLSILMKKYQPNAIVTGVDVDEKALKIAQSKISKQLFAIYLKRILPGKLEFESNLFDKVFSSLVFHHLTKEQKLDSLFELYRTLKPGGTLWLADWGKPQNKLMRIAFYLVQALDGFETTTDNVKGFLPNYLANAGFQKIEEVNYYNTIYGTLSIYRAIKPLKQTIKVSDQY